MILIGIDPSYSRTGLIIMNTESKEIRSIKVENKIGEKDFVNLYNKANDQSNKIIKEIPNKIDYVMSECPLPQAQFSSGLFALDSLMLYKLSLNRPKMINVLHPSYLKYIHKSSKYTKTDSVNLAKSFLEVFTKNGYIFSVNGRWSNDECEAFIFSVRLFVSLKIDNVIIRELALVNSRILDKKENKLYESEE